MVDRLVAYREKLTELSDIDLVDEVEQMVWLSGYAANNARSEYHIQCDATHDECKRREKPWLYQRGWNKAYRSAGYEPSDADREAARAPQS